MQFDLLGPVVVREGDHLVPLRRRRERLLLALLLLHPGKPVSVERLIEWLWDTSSPDTARAAISVSVSRLRQDLGRVAEGSVTIRSGPAGYTIDADPASIDVNQFQDRVSAAAALTDPAHRSSVLAGALRLWRGEPLADVATPLVRERLLVPLIEEHLSAVELWVETEMTLGHHEALLPQLARMTAEHPARERLIAAYMLALYRVDRPMDALDVYERTARRLADEFGLDLTPRVQALRTAILRNDYTLAWPVASTLGPCFLPRAVGQFTGREPELAMLDDIAGGPAIVPLAVVSALTGGGGAGKTALAVQWAHTATARFPDAQLYVNVHGYGKDAPLTTHTALNLLLGQLGVGPEDLPVSEAAAVNAFRARLTGRRVLLIIDNANSPEQVRPLLPSAPGCLAVVTSRDKLTGLVAMDGARRVLVDLMRPDEAVALIAAIIGADRVAAEPAAAAGLAEVCGRLPLALRIAAASLADEPGMSIEAWVTKLSSANRLSHLVIHGDPDNSVLVAYTHSYLRLSPVTRHMFRRLGTAPGSEIGRAAAAAAADLGIDDATRSLADLVAAHLVEELKPGRYSMHDLIREYATSIAELEESPALRDAADRRLAGWYLAYAPHAANDIRQGAPLAMDWAGPRPDDAPFSDRNSALAWYDLEGSNIIAAVRPFADTHPDLSWRLGSTTFNWFERLSQTDTWVDTYAIGTRAAVACEDPMAELKMLTGWAVALCYGGRQSEALPHFQRCLELQRAVGAPPVVLVVAMMNLGGLYGELHRMADAVAVLTEALTIVEASPDLEPKLAGVLHNIGFAYHLADDLWAAVPYLRRSLTIAQRLDDHLGVSLAAFTLGQVLGTLDDPEAQEMLHRALDAATVARHPLLQARAHGYLAVMHAKAGRLDEARTHLGMLRDCSEGYKDLPSIAAEVAAAEAASATG